MKYIDVLVDGEFVQELKNTNLRWRGSSNQRVIDVQQSLKQADPGIPVLHCCD
jgi:anaerobic ribonucleoside-triphosphate reductase activating protein